MIDHTVPHLTPVRSPSFAERAMRWHRRATMSMTRIDPRGTTLPGGSAVAVGMFDGVHRGHRQLLAELRAHANSRGLATVVVTFDPHPRRILQPASAPPMLCRLEDRLELLAATGLVDHCLVLPFDRQRSQESADDFVETILLDRLGMRVLVVGENFACGRGRQGDIAYLRSAGARLGFEVHAQPLHRVAAADRLGPCSSTVVRRLVVEGDVAAAAIVLDRPHSLSGTLTEVDAEGGRVGVAIPPGLCLPPDGEYVGAVQAPMRGTGWRSTRLAVRRDDCAARQLVLISALSGMRAGESVEFRFHDQVAVRCASAHATV